jgi:hypothetical protein
MTDDDHLDRQRRLLHGAQRLKETLLDLSEVRCLIVQGRGAGTKDQKEEFIRRATRYLAQSKQHIK